MQTLSNFTHVDAKDLSEAVELLSGDSAVAIAGGTDLLGVMRFRILREYPETVVNLKTISPSLDYIKEEGGFLKVGALTRLEDIAHSSIVKGKYTALAQAAERTASPHIRESGTIGGNICQHNRCWYFWKEENRFDCIRKGGNMCYAMAGENRFHSIFGALNACVAVNPSDTAPALVVLNAKIITTKREIAAEDFWAFSIPGSTVLEKGEIVKEIQFPAPAAGVKSAFAKFAMRRSIDFPIANCAAAIGGGSARICLNAVYNKPYRATKAEDSIKGKTIDTDSAETAAAAGVSSATALALNKYKISVAKGVMKQAILACK
ncbi:MAG: FAD binding domain-containing protein [Dehalococcoidales bacterium]|nr:FAD binding domain-containing protein [Dehalococcoidales bacterium]MDD4230544.1 FAD binding domain-containing protein [Dehalococcoidales bacterium]